MNCGETTRGCSFRGPIDAAAVLGWRLSTSLYNDEGKLDHVAFWDQGDPIDQGLFNSAFPPPRP
jgi:hypothetical protein